MFCACFSCVLKNTMACMIYRKAAGGGANVATVARRQAGHRQDEGAPASLVAPIAAAGKAGRLLHQHGAWLCPSTIPHANRAPQRIQVLTVQSGCCCRRRTYRQWAACASPGAAGSSGRQKSGRQRKSGNGSACGRVPEATDSDPALPIPGGVLHCRWAAIVLQVFSL